MYEAEESRGYVDAIILGRQMLWHVCAHVHVYTCSKFGTCCHWMSNGIFVQHILGH